MKQHDTGGCQLLCFVVLVLVIEDHRFIVFILFFCFCFFGVQVDPGTMQFLMSTAALPMVAKPIYGIISDSVYIKGAHRVPYLIVAGEQSKLLCLCIVSDSADQSL